MLGFAFEKSVIAVLALAVSFMGLSVPVDVSSVDVEIFEQYEGYYRGILRIDDKEDVDFEVNEDAGKVKIKFKQDGDKTTLIYDRDTGKGDLNPEDREHVDKILDFIEKQGSSATATEEQPEPEIDLQQEYENAKGWIYNFLDHVTR